MATGWVFVATEHVLKRLGRQHRRCVVAIHVGTPRLCGDIHNRITGTWPTHQPLGNWQQCQARRDRVDIYTGTVLLNENIDPPGANPAFQLQRVSLALTDGRKLSGQCGRRSTGSAVSAPRGWLDTVANLPGDSQCVWVAAPSIMPRQQCIRATRRLDNNDNAVTSAPPPRGPMGDF